MAMLPPNDPRLLAMPQQPVINRANGMNDLVVGLEKPEQEGMAPTQPMSVEAEAEQTRDSLAFPVERFRDADQMQKPIGTQGPVNKQTVRKAYDVLQKYRQGKANLEARIVENEKWYTMHCDEAFRDGNATPSAVETQDSAWLFNSLANKHADFMDNYPEPNVLPRSQDDEKTASTLSSVLQVALEQNHYEKVYSDAVWYKLKHGTSCKAVVWDPDKLNGLGDIAIRHVDLLNLFWEPGITDIQMSRNLFHVELVDNEVLAEMYPWAKRESGTPAIDTAKYNYDDTVDTSEKSAVVDWYYKRAGVLHFCKFVNDTVLYATENDPEYAQRGLYDHGKYPFILDTLFPKAHSPVGFGYVDVMKGCQRKIDRLDNSVVLNAMFEATPRFFVRSDGSVNEREFADLGRNFVHVDGQLGEDSIRQMVAARMDSMVPTVLANKVAELKETSGNRDYSQGSTTSGVTAASAIAALQEAGSKLSRDMIAGAYRSYEEECYLCIELMRQFYDTPREFRITGEDMMEAGQSYGFTTFDNRDLLPQAQDGMVFGVDVGSRLPVFDIKVVAARKSTYSRTSQNELAKELYRLGLFNPQNSDQAMVTVGMMDFDGKDKIMAKIQANGGLFEENQMLQEQIMKLGLVAAQQGVAMGDQHAADAGAAITQNAIANARQKAATQNNGSAAKGGGKTTTVNPLGDAVTGNSLSTQAIRRAQNAASPGGGQ